MENQCHPQLHLWSKTSSTEKRGAQIPLVCDAMLWSFVEVDFCFYVKHCTINYCLPVSSLCTNSIVWSSQVPEFNNSLGNEILLQASPICLHGNVSLQLTQRVWSGSSNLKSKICKTYIADHWHQVWRRCIGRTCFKKPIFSVNLLRIWFYMNACKWFQSEKNCFRLHDIWITALQYTLILSYL